MAYQLAIWRATCTPSLTRLADLTDPAATCHGGSERQDKVDDILEDHVDNLLLFVQLQ